MKPIEVFVKKTRRGTRIQPMGCVVLALGLLVCIACGVGISRTASGPDIVIDDTAESTTAATARPTVKPTAGPTVEPTVEPTEEPTPHPTTTSPEVVELHFLQSWGWLFDPIDRTKPRDPAEITTYFAPLPDDPPAEVFTKAPQAWWGLTTVESYISEDHEYDHMARIHISGGKWFVEVTDISEEDGWAVVKAKWNGKCSVHLIRISTGEIVQSESGECLWYLAGMLRDDEDGRWKISSLHQSKVEPGD